MTGFAPSAAVGRGNRVEMMANVNMPSAFGCWVDQSEAELVDFVSGDEHLGAEWRRGVRQSAQACFADHPG